MSHHLMVLSEADPSKAGYIRRYYATIDISLSGNKWYWQQIDAHGAPIGNANGPFDSEGNAKNNALITLNGDDWT